MFEQQSPYVVLREFRSVLLVLVAALLALVEPGGGELLKPLVVTLLIYSSIRGIDFAAIDIGALSLPLFGIVIAYVLVPGVAHLVGNQLLAGGPLIGVLAMCAGPATAGSAVVWARLGDGDIILTATVVFGTILLAPVVIPVLVTGLVDTEIHLRAVPLVRDLGVVVIGGVVLEWIVPEEAVNDAWLNRLALLGIAALVYIGVADSGAPGAGVDVLGRVAVAALVVCGAVLGTIVAADHVFGFGRRRVRALFFAAELKNLGIGITVVTSIPLDGAIIGVVGFYVVQQVIAGTVASLGAGPTN